MSVVPFDRFDALYQDAVRRVARFCTPEAQAAVAAHCEGWAPGRFDFRNYLRASSPRFYRAYRALAAREGVRSVCDVGGFWGVFAIALRGLGYRVTLTEALGYYGDAFRDLFAFIRGNGVDIVDCDPFEPRASLPGPFDAVTVMAVLEHYPHSLAAFMGNLRALVRASGVAYVEVPNIAYWPKRLALLWGQTPLVPIDVIYRSKTPFTGHHHEFTIAELRTLMGLAGFRVLEEGFFTYSAEGSFLQRLRESPVGTLVQMWVPETREVMAVLCEPRPAGTAAP